MTQKPDRPLHRIDLFIPRVSQYQVLHHFTQKLYEALQRAGYQCRLIDAKQDLDLLNENPPDLTVGFNGVPRNESGDLLCDFLKIPHLSCLVDPPYHFLYLYKSPWVITACDDLASCRLLKIWGEERHLLFPHAVEPELLEEKREAPCFDLVMLATFVDFEKRRENWKKKYPRAVYRCMEMAIELFFSNPRISFIEALDQMLEEEQRKGQQELFSKIKHDELLKELEYYVKGRDRVELLKAAKEFPLHIFGNSIDERGWKEYCGNQFPYAQFHSSVNYEQAIQIMKRTKILLNPSMKNREGAHERIFTGIAAGSAVVTSESQYLINRFKEGEELLYYRSATLSSLGDMLSQYLSDESKRLHLVDNGVKKILEGETWDQRVVLLERELPPLITHLTHRERDFT